MSRPTEDMSWAEDSDALTEEPAALRARGWPFGFVPPADILNWLGRGVGRWIAWLESKADNHVHDGGAGDMSAPKVNFNDHLEVNGNGTLTAADVVDGIEDWHEIEHAGSGRLARIKSDAFLANGFIRCERIESNTSSIIFDDGAGGYIDVRAAVGTFDRLVADNATKASAKISSAGAIESGFGVSSVSTSGGTGIYELTLASTPPTTARIQVTPSTPLRFASAYVVAGTPNTVVVETFDSAGAAASAGFFIDVYWD